MRFAVSLLMFICVASVIGTVLMQNQLPSTYFDQFGPFWYEVFDKFAIWQVYNSWWFLLIMGFLVVSTTICVIRNTPRFIKDARSFREHVRGTSLRAFPHRADAAVPERPDEALNRLRPWLRKNGYAWRERQDGDSIMLAAKKGGANRLGYIFAHVAIVIICIGGLLDSELPVRLQVWLFDKKPVTQNMLISQVPESGKLSLANPSFRGNMLVPEGATASNALIGVDNGLIVQPLPFNLRLKDFVVEYYSTGMPSSFRSVVEVTDHETGESFERNIEVNEPLRYRGVTVYQSSFDDGGSSVELTGYPLRGASSRPFKVKGVVGSRSPIALSEGGRETPLDIEFTALRVINVEDLGSGDTPQPKAVIDHVASVAGSAAASSNENMRNVGPSVQYRIIGADGQSFEYTNYMLPIELDGSRVILAGIRESEAVPFRYVRIPVDENDRIEEFMSLRAALQEPGLVTMAAQRFAQANANERIDADMLTKAAIGALDAFQRQGFNGILGSVPESEHEKVLSFAVPMIQMSLTELRDLVRARDGRPTIAREGEAWMEGQRWVQMALLALANLPDYPAPVFLTLDSFEHKEASVFQVTRSPGKNTVYLGSLFLVIGVFAMFYVRDRRIWVWAKATENGTELHAAMTSQRRNLDFNHEFDRFKEAFKRLTT
ncbi:MAG TPA: cytochrome c biogenesis protein ResB [Burkholderiaceae bacterium]|nr:cytochrome c biogenesis protein ResB [Burkholderiaceae bacterium]